ncbi:hypothetical protein EMCG_01236 [[Emmonsia] crescens]|uniref:Uncharacterized protein n=1 Tax=[Emmonsia] crescens TaxID=73230 RepID=A0A0G2I4Y2_9EURO|nr:hypothetical protein EMCG_01236 [Emmonsia crescens UAMH 3008]
MFLRASSLFLVLLLIASASTSASASARFRSRSELKIPFGEAGPCSIKTEDSYVSVFKCEKEICLSSPVLEDAGCCEPDGCSWHKSCIPYDSVEGHSSDGASDKILSCSDPTRQYCQFATFRKESAPESGYSLGTCTSNSHQPDLRIDLLSVNSGSIVSQPLENDHSYQLRIRAMSHKFSKRATGTSSRNAGVVGGLVAFWLLVLLLCLFVSRSKRARNQEVPAPTGNNNTAVYIMNPQSQPPGVQYPPLAYMYPPGQVPEGQTQTIYIQGPPPPGAQPIQLSQSPAPFPQPHPSYPQPPPAYQK